VSTTRTLDLFIEPERAGSYFTLPFEMPANTARLTLRCRYERRRERPAEGGFRAREEINIVDLGLVAPDGELVGASGSDKSEISVSATEATPGYRPAELVPGQWAILVGAYKVAPEGVRVTYELVFEEKRPRWLRGDLHTHTLASDGVLTAGELAAHALRHGLDFLAVTDHNQMVSAEELPRVEGLALIPGVEWTHYRGHANFLGVGRPYDGSFAAGSLDEARAIFETARSRGALITLNHPFEEICPWGWGFDALPFDCLEVWNGPMREANLRSLGLWQQLLAAGKHVPAVCGSDYHRDRPFQILGGPTLCALAGSASPADILAAARAGCSYMVFAPDGPALEQSPLPGACVRWNETRGLRLEIEGLAAGDQVRVVTAAGSETLGQAAAGGSFAGEYELSGPGFARVEVWREFLPGVPRLPALLANPVYFE